MPLDQPPPLDAKSFTSFRSAGSVGPSKWRALQSAALPCTFRAGHDQSLPSGVGPESNESRSMDCACNGRYDRSCVRTSSAAWINRAERALVRALELPTVKAHAGDAAPRLARSAPRGSSHRQLRGLDGQNLQPLRACGKLATMCNLVVAECSVVPPRSKPSCLSWMPRVPSTA